MKLSHNDLIEVCRVRAIRQLRSNLVEEGIMAAAPTPEAEQRRYTRIFGRDAAICALGMAVSGDPHLLEGAKRGLLTLAEHQAENGQIPKYVDPRANEPDFWYLGCIDATLWWLIAVHRLSRQDPVFAGRCRQPIDRAIGWLHCQEHPRLRLLQQNEASDWADIMPRSGFVLYSNALWYYVKVLYGLAAAEETKFHFNHLFFPFSRDIPDYARLRLLTHYVRRCARTDDLYLSYVNFSFWGAEGDVLGNLLAIILGLATEGPANRVLRALQRVEISRPFPVRAVCHPIQVRGPQWRRYMGRHRQNLEYQYHNGGIWPFIGGFWVIALALAGRGLDAEQALHSLAEVNRQGNWAFREWFHGKSGEPHGMPGQSWNAAMFLLAQNVIAHPSARNCFREGLSESRETNTRRIGKET